MVALGCKWLHWADNALQTISMSNRLTTIDTCLLGPNRVIHVLKPDV